MLGRPVEVSKPIEQNFFCCLYSHAYILLAIRRYLIAIYEMVRCIQGGSAIALRGVVLPRVWHEADSDSVGTLVSEIFRNAIAPCLSVACIAASREVSR